MSGTRRRFLRELPPRSMRDRFEATCDMHDVAIAQLVARLRRARPEVTEVEIDAAVADWLRGGDPGWGRVVKLPR